MESLRNLIDIIKYHHKPTSWTDWRRMVIKGQISGIDRQLARFSPEDAEIVA